MESVIKGLQDDRINHPVVIILGCRQEVSQVSLVVEREALPMTYGMASAVEWLMKFHFVLNMEFAPECKHILNFLQSTVLGIEDAMPLAQSAVDLSLYIRNKCCRN